MQIPADNHLPWVHSCAYISQALHTFLLVLLLFPGENCFFYTELEQTAMGFSADWGLFWLKAKQQVKWETSQTCALQGQRTSKGQAERSVGCLSFSFFPLQNMLHKCVNFQTVYFKKKHDTPHRVRVGASSLSPPQLCCLQNSHSAYTPDIQSTFPPTHSENCCLPLTELQLPAPLTNYSWEGQMCPECALKVWCGSSPWFLAFSPLPWFTRIYFLYPNKTRNLLFC